MIRLFTGFDQREAIGWHACAQSVIERASQPVALIPLGENLDLPHRTDGSNAFTYARFYIPSLCEWRGHAIFIDGADMIVTDDVVKLWNLREERYAVQVVKHEYVTKHPVKYVGTEMECANRDYPRKNWSSVIIWNCAHRSNRFLTPGNVADMTGADLHRFSWLQDDEIGELPMRWNWMSQEYGANTTAQLLHFTAGIPSIKAYEADPHYPQWIGAHTRANQEPRERK